MITYSISSSLSDTTLTVSGVKVKFKNDNEEYLVDTTHIDQITDKITCSIPNNEDTGNGTGNESNKEEDSGKIIHLSKYLIIIFLFVF